MFSSACERSWRQTESRPGSRRSARLLMRVFALVVITVCCTFNLPHNWTNAKSLGWNSRSLMSLSGNSSVNDSCPSLTALDLDWSSLHHLGLTYSDLVERCDVEELEILADFDLSSSGVNHSVLWEECDFEEANHPALFLAIYILLVIVLFVGLAIICDDFFVPSLEAISERLDLSEDVAGATFMAAGSSAPELFTSMASVGVTSDVGVGTIVGSAVFNILIIIALSALLAGQVLLLDWKPMFRDSLIYAISIGLFIVFTWDGVVEHYESGVLLVLYILYVVIMKFNTRLMRCLSRLSCKVSPSVEVVIDVERDKDDDAHSNRDFPHSSFEESRRHTVAVDQRHRFVHLRGQELSGSFVNRRPLLSQQHIANLFSSAVAINGAPGTEMSASAVHRRNESSRLTGSFNTLRPSDNTQRRGSHQYPLQSRSLFGKSPVDSDKVANNTQPPSIALSPVDLSTSKTLVQTFVSPPDDDVSVTRTVSSRGGSTTSLRSSMLEAGKVDEQIESEEKNEKDEELKPCPCLPAISAQLPSSDSLKSASNKGACFCLTLWFIFKWILFLISFPFMCVFTWTVPPCSKPEHRKYFVASFLMSIVWIAVLSFGVVVLVSRVGCILDVDSYTMGLVVVAIGTSVPDALSSVLVARDGYGDMAVSNAIGSNVFDINLGLGLPFLVKSLIQGGKPILLLTPVELVAFRLGLYDIIPHAKFGFILLIILIIAVSSFAIVKFKLNRFIGVFFIIIYFLFLFYAFWQDIKCYKGRTC